MHNISQDKLQELADKWLKGTISVQESELLDECYNKQSPEYIEWVSEDKTEDELRQRLFAGIKDNIKQPAKLKVKHTKGRWIWAAASILIGGLALICIKNPDTAKTNIHAKVKVDILPGGNKATVSLADGRKVVLSEANIGEVANQSGISIVKTADGQLTYVGASSTLGSFSDYNTVSTPIGGQYQVLLPDGSKVWLNAASSITFPTQFSGTERRVELKGEAYFEIAKRTGHSFLVKFNEEEVRVLGTHFNIDAYERESKTTLTEGAIAIKSALKLAYMKPGDQAIASDGKMTVSANADIDKAIAWKEGMFYFNKDKFTDVMKQVSRWYAVDVKYDGEISKKHFVGHIRRQANLSQVLKMLTLVSGAKFNLEGKILTVKFN